MDTKAGDFFKRSHSALSFAGICVFSWSALVCGLAISVLSINRNPAISISLDRLFWWGNIELAVRPIEFEDVVPTPESIVITQSSATQEVARPTVQIQSRIVKHKIARKPAPKKSDIVKNESDVLLAMHQYFQNRFVIALDTQKNVNTHLAKNPIQASPAKRAKPILAAAPVQRPASTPKKESTDFIITNASSAVLDAPPLSYKPIKPIKTLKEVAKSDLAAKIKIKPQNKPPKPVLLAANDTFDRPDPGSHKIQRSITDGMPAAPLREPTPVKVANSDLPSVTEMNTQEDEYSKAWKLVSEAPQKKADVIVKKVEYPNPAAPQPPQPAPPAPEKKKCQNSLLPEGYLCASDGFSSLGEPYAVKAEVLSHEGSARESHQAKWISAKKDEYWNTVSMKSLIAENDPVPMLSNNTTQLLAKWAGVTLQKSAGIVFGQVPPGWSIELSNRAEAPIYLDERRQLVASPFSSSPHSFAFLNAAPGMQLLSLKTSSGSAGPVIAIPILEGTATHIKIDSVDRKTVAGKILDGRNSRFKGLSGIQVRVIGQESKPALTNNDGAFLIPEISIAPGYSLYIEIEGKGGFPHRYRVQSKDVHNVSLFRFHPVQVQRWVGQMSHDISEDSALVISALPKLVADNESTPLYPRVNPLLNQATLQPKTFSLNREDWILAHSPLKKESPRFISIQIPNGPNICKVEDNENKMHWSELIFSSPRVINVVGPDF